jgi:hypothetical protein
MNLERNYQLLEEICKNPSQSYLSIITNISNEKNLHPSERGEDSERIISWLLRQIPDVIRVTPVHKSPLFLDCDLESIVVNSLPVYVQVKTTEKEMKSFRRSLRRLQLVMPEQIRIAVLAFERPFEQIQQDFVNQVNNLNQKRTLRDVMPQKRKRY